MQSPLLCIEKGFTGRGIAAGSKITSNSTIDRVIRNFQARGSIVVKKASG